MLDFASVFFPSSARREYANPMKTTTPSLKFFHPAALAALAIVITYGLSLRTAQAGYIVTLLQVGPDVVATGSGALNLTGLSFTGNTVYPAAVDPSAGLIQTGPTTSSVSVYSVTFSGPISFGSGVNTFANSGTGDFVGRQGGSGFLVVPVGYVSGTALSDTSTYDTATFSTLGVTPGTYEWTWGTGANQNFTLLIGPAAVPDSGSTFVLLLVSLVALIGVSRFRSLRLA
jgi:hypothetical protein